MLLDEMSAALLEKAQSEEGLTYKEYYETKIEFILQLIKKFDNSIDEAVLERSRNILKNLTPEKIDSIIQLIGTLSDDCAPQDIAGCVTEMVQFQLDTMHQNGSIKPSIGDIPQHISPEQSELSLNQMEASGQLDKKIKFDDAYFLERGVLYCEEAINDYALKNSQFEILNAMHNVISTIDAFREDIFSDNTSEIILGTSGSEKLNNLLNVIYGGNLECVEKDLADTGLSFTVNDGKISVTKKRTSSNHNGGFEFNNET